MKTSLLVRFAVISLAYLSAISSFSANAITLKELAPTSQVQAGFVDILYDTKAGKTYLKIDNLGQEFIYQTSLPSGLGSNDIGLDR
ncbi:MAG: hypothetical protein JKX81_18295, partial [Arenicella sp.]|nr:hypothetical protein [Arenicella sp.]